MNRYLKLKGGENVHEKIDAVQKTLDDIQSQLDELRKKEAEMPKLVEPELVEPELAMSEVTMSKPESAVVKTWQDDKNIKFKGVGPVSLTFSRIISNIKKKSPDATNSTGEKWSVIKEKLEEANSTDEVQEIINTYKLNLSSNNVGGTKKRRRRNKKGTYKRRH